MIYSHEDVQIQYDIFGNGTRPLLILHGWGGPEVWYSFIDKLALNNFQIFLLHLPPFGQSERPKSIPTLEWYAKLVHDFVKYLELSEITTIGHSMGGQIAIFAEAQYNLSQNLILIGSSGIKRFYLMPFIKNKLVKSVKKMGNLLGFSTEKMSRSKLFLKLLSSRDFQNSDLYQREVLKNMVNTDISDKLSKIKAHTLCIWGEDDKESPLINGIDIYRTIKKYRTDLNQKIVLKIISRANHFPFIEYPDTVNSLILSFARP